MLKLNYKRIDRRGVKCCSCGDIIHPGQEAIKITIEETPTVHLCGQCMYIFRDDVLLRIMEKKEINTGECLHDCINARKESVSRDKVAGEFKDNRMGRTAVAENENKRLSVNDKQFQKVRT